MRIAAGRRAGEKYTEIHNHMLSMLPRVAGGAMDLGERIFRPQAPADATVINAAL